MKFSEFFSPTQKDIPAEAEIISHQLMIRSGMIKQSSAGIYSWLPLGLKVLKNIENIVREEQNNAGAIELLMPTIRDEGSFDFEHVHRLKKIVRVMNQSLLQSFLIR